MADQRNISQQLRGVSQYPTPDRRNGNGNGNGNGHPARLTRSTSSTTLSTLSLGSRLSSHHSVVDSPTRSLTLHDLPDLPELRLPTMPTPDKATRSSKPTMATKERPSIKQQPSRILRAPDEKKGVELSSELENGELGVKTTKEEDDPWDVALEEINPGTKWSERTTFGKVKFVAWTILRLLILLGLLYLFICALDFLATAFRLLGGEAAGEVLQNSELLANPVCGLMIGILVTVLVQSSSTSTSIIVSMASARIISVRLAIPIIMGANIGTSVTNTIVSLGQAREKNEFRRAFGGATVHDMFNWLAVLILLPLEVIAQPLYRLTDTIVTSASIAKNDVKIEILKVITKPFTSLVIKIDKKAITKQATNENITSIRLLKTCLPDVPDDSDMVTLAPGVTTLAATTEAPKECDWHWFAYSGFTDTVAGIVMLVFALALLCICLVLIVKTLNSLLKGSIAIIIKKFVNADFPGYLAFLTGYLAIVIGAVCTFIVQSSSIFTSAITPLVGIGVITLDRMYPLTLGANIGTTATGIIAALPNEGLDLANALQVALSHFFFNIFGILIWYPLPFMRKLPIAMARINGNTTAKYRWFPIFYLILMFFVIPALAFALSIAGNIYLFVIGGIVLFTILVVGVMTVLQNKLPRVLPPVLRSWDFLPWWLHSLEPLDYVFGCRSCRKGVGRDDKMPALAAVDTESGATNQAFDSPL